LGGCHEGALGHPRTAMCLGASRFFACAMMQIGFDPKPRSAVAILKLVWLWRMRSVIKIIGIEGDRCEVSPDRDGREASRSLKILAPRFIKA
jgi:hypothetical protein